MVMAVSQISEHPDAFTVLEQLDNAQDKQQLIDIFDRYLRDIGLTTFIFAEIANLDMPFGKNLVFGTSSPSYLKKYWHDGNMYHDPLIRALLRANSPIQYSTVNDVTNMDRNDRKTMDLRRDQGIFDGYAFPLKGRLNRFTTVGVHGNVDHLSYCDIAILEMLIQGLYRRATYLHPLPKHLSEEKSAGLTNRERECLTWAAKGKTNWDISQILLITERTVQYHIQNARKKLGADSRLQAVVLAVKTLKIVL